MSGSPYPDAKQPLKTNRTYIPAVWAAAGGGSGHPKLAGGEYQSRQGTVEAPRAFNRPDQRYSETEAVLQAKRVVRANDEYPITIVAAAAFGLILFRSMSGSYYYAGTDATDCNCADKWRLLASGKPGVSCKHELMGAMALTQYGGYDNLPWSTSRLAEVLGIAEGTAAKLCENETIPATKTRNTWLVTIDAPTSEAIDAYIAKLVKRDRLFTLETEE